MPQFRKKPVVIEAMQFRRDDTGNEILKWANAGLLPSDKARVEYVDETGRMLRVATLEGNMLANPGDWIIRGVKRRVLSVQAGDFRGDLRSGRRDAVNRLWRNWTVHNIVSHPLSEVVYWLTFWWAGDGPSGWVHDVTIPDNAKNGRG